MSQRKPKPLKHREMTAELLNDKQPEPPMPKRVHVQRVTWIPVTGWAWMPGKAVSR